jgi:hypothetical protein
MAQTPSKPAATEVKPAVTAPAAQPKTSSLLSAIARPQRERSIVDLLTTEAYDRFKAIALEAGYRDFADYCLNALAEKAERDGVSF